MVHSVYIDSVHIHKVKIWQFCGLYIGVSIFLDNTLHSWNFSSQLKPIVKIGLVSIARFLYDILQQLNFLLLWTTDNKLDGCRASSNGPNYRLQQTAAEIRRDNEHAR